MPKVWVNGKAYQDKIMCAEFCSVSNCHQMDTELPAQLVQLACCHSNGHCQQSCVFLIHVLYSFSS